MSQANPKIGIDAILPATKTVAGYTINTIKLGIMAILEKIESPVCSGGEMTLFNMLPTMYVLTHDYRSILMAIDNNTFPETVMTWADSVESDVMLRLQDACLDEITKAFDAGPKVSSDSPLV